mgnify:CR=1 FL=1
MKIVKLCLEIIDSPWVVRFFEKSGRLPFKPTNPGAPKDKVYLELKRIRSIYLLRPKGVAINMSPKTVLVEYETENIDYYQRFTVDVSEVERLVKDDKIELIPVEVINIITEWDADEAMAGYKIDLRTGEVEHWDVRNEYLDLVYDLFYGDQ